MKILITGNMGYIGPCVVQRLRTSYPEAKIIGLDTGFFANCLTNSEILPECRVNMQYFEDVRKVSIDLLKDIDAIIHLAAVSNDPMGNTYEKVTHEINYLASIDLARKAKDAGVKSFVYASSCSMYGAADDGPRTEASPVNPLTAYARSKIATEKDLQTIADNKFKVTSLRFSTACGMSERLRLDLVLNDFVACAITSKQITILSDGTPWRPLINIKDMAKAIDWAIKRDINNGGEFLAVNVGSDGWNYQVRELAEFVAKAIPDVKISINKNAQPDKRSYRVSFELFRKLASNYQPDVDIITTILELKRGLEAMHFNDQNFRTSMFMRLKVLNHLRETGMLSETLEWTSKNK
ncbi:NAD dependent epimerase/dehydratase family [Candidatus Brocadia pituitae]|nr:NAD dependent epimerase/dehydratase family [Candidatus Brocadia pituitae]